MKPKLKPLDEQTIVITGASSGIGLVTARLAAERGAKLVLAARNEEALKRLTEELTARGQSAVYVVADVGRQRDVEKIGRTAEERFGGVDTWVNNAATGIYGRLTEVADADSRRLFDTNFWGTVYGSLEAVKHLKGRGGALINVGSALSDRAIPVQGMYATSKHAVKGFTDALRVEVEADELPISVTLVKPASIDTPFPQHAKNYLSEEPTLPPPVYAPEVVARAIVHCATRPERDLTVGGGGKLISAFQGAPGLADRAMSSEAFLEQLRDGPHTRDPEGALYRPAFGLRERGQYPGHVRQTSLHTGASRRPLATGAVLAAAGLVLAGLLTGERARRR